RLIPIAREITEETLAPLSAKEAAIFMRLLAKLA
ncbi:MAG: MarR family transcriptional regulator, partial [Mesorhizobium sp.]